MSQLKRLGSQEGSAVPPSNSPAPPSSSQPNPPATFQTPASFPTATVYPHQTISVTYRQTAYPVFETQPESIPIKTGSVPQTSNLMVNSSSRESIVPVTQSPGDSVSLSQGDASSRSEGSVYVYVEEEKDDLQKEQGTTEPSPQEQPPAKIPDSQILFEAGDAVANRKEKRVTKRKLPDEDRRRATWIPCTFPQYKVSKELANKWETQSMFFGKILIVKVAQLLLINLAVFATVFEGETARRFFVDNHEWVYLGFGLFLAMLACVRWIVSYRSRWPMFASFLVMIPLTAIIAVSCACVATIYHSFILLMITSTLFLTFLMLCFVPYLLRKSVIHRSTNVTGGVLALFSSVTLIFLKEFDNTSAGYWDYLATVWLPDLVLSQITVQITIFEIQRIIFGLCFNVSSKRWHVAAAYI